MNCCKSGPWGDLLYSSFPLEPPAALIDGFPSIRENTRWVFANAELPQVLEHLRTTGCPEEQVAEWQQSGRIQRQGAHVVVLPTPAFVATLTSENRSRLYELLGQGEANFYQKYPYLYPRRALAEWFAGSRLPGEAIEAIRKMIYYRHDTALFSDLEPILQLLEHQPDRVELQRTLLRTRTLLLRLKIRPATDLSKVTEYWSGSGLNREVITFIESIARLPGENEIDVLHLLPPLARRHLYTFPDPRQDRDFFLKDCFWTALNFFNPVADDRLSTPEYRFQYVSGHFYPVEAPYQLGDVFLFSEADAQEPFHAAVYLADDLYFTKNGWVPNSPWVIMSSDDMTSSYLATNARHLRYQVLRRRQFS